MAQKPCVVTSNGATGRSIANHARAISHPLSRVTSGGGAVSLLAVTGLIACKNARLFEVFSCPDHHHRPSTDCSKLSPLTNIGDSITDRALPRWLPWTRGGCACRTAGADQPGRNTGRCLSTVRAGAIIWAGLAGSCPRRCPRGAPGPGSLRARIARPRVAWEAAMIDLAAYVLEPLHQEGETPSDLLRSYPARLPNPQQQSRPSRLSL